MGSPNTVIYTGEYRHNRDAKGRLTVPSKWRVKDGDQDVYLALPNPTKGCITVYPPERAAKFLERMSEIDLADEEQQEALMELSSMAQSFSYDAQGRISLDDHLLEFAGIEGKEVVLLGNFGTFSIWSQEKYDSSVSKSVKERTAKLNSSLSKLGKI